MKRIPVALLVVLLAFAAGWLLGNAQTADAAPAPAWDHDVEEWYLETGPLYLTFRQEVEGFFGEVFTDQGAAFRRLDAADIAGSALAEIDPPVRMLAVDESMQYSIRYCRQLMEWIVESPGEDNFDVFSVPMWLHMRDNCIGLIYDTKIERARYAAEHGPFPELPTRTPTPAVTETPAVTATATITP
jgi:hypothetical protein